MWSRSPDGSCTRYSISEPFLPNQSIVGKIRWQHWLLQSHDLLWCLPLCSQHTSGVTISHAGKRDCSLFILFCAVSMCLFSFAQARMCVCVRIHRFLCRMKIHTAAIEGYYCHLLSPRDGACRAFYRASQRKRANPSPVHY